MQLPSIPKYLLIVLLLILSRIISAQPAAPLCGTNDSLNATYLARLVQTRDLTRARTSVGQKLQYRLGIDINYNTYLAYNGDKERIMQTLYLFVGKASEVFERETNIKLTIVDVLIWDHPEPYIAVVNDDYIININKYWSENRPSASRDAVVGMSIRVGTFQGGFRVLTSSFPTPGDEHYSPDVLSHELGHSLGSPHTHNCSWPGGPIDYCEKVEQASSTCQGEFTEQLIGTIMSYCHDLMTFHPYCRSLMRHFADGLVRDDFKLLPVGDKISQPGKLARWTELASAIPSFSWPASENALRYRFQIAADQSFGAITEDTLVGQAFYTSIGSNSGAKFARYRIENEAGNGAWSNVVPFTVPALSETTEPPLVQAAYRSDQKLSVTLKPYEGTDALEIEIRDYYSGEVYALEQPVTTDKVQTWLIPTKLKVNWRYEMRVRLRTNNTRTAWSAYKTIDSPTGLAMLAPANTDSTAISASGVLPVDQFIGNRAKATVVNSIEIATDAAFRSVVFRDSATNFSINSWFRTKFLFKPQLEENARYYARMRVNEPYTRRSEWSVSSFRTALSDSRITFLNPPSPGLLSTGFIKAERMRSRFYHSGDKLYIFTKQLGYFVTDDLKAWQNFTPSTTAGNSPAKLNYFGVSEKGDVYVMDATNKLVKNSETGYQHWNPGTTFYSNDYASMIATDTSGILFVSSSHGMGRFKDGQWSFFDKYTAPGNNNVPGFEKDNNNVVWALEYPGTLWSYRDNRWKIESRMDFNLEPVGIAFDRNNICYAYGNGGVAKWNAVTGAWMKISELATFNVKKIVFDAQNNMWVASYKWPSDYRYAALLNYALVRFDGTKTNVYTEGLGIAREPFDLEYFDNKLVLLTSSGDLIAFDESRIQRFAAKELYAVGEKASILITSLSPFGKDNEFSLTIKAEETGMVTPVVIDQVNGAELHFTIPDLPAGKKYRIRTHSTQPEIHSNESDLFMIGTEIKEVILKQNIPNPAGASTDISFYLPEPALVELTLFNQSGQKLANLLSGNMAAGWHNTKVPVDKLSKGVYIYSLKAGGFTKSLKMIR